jgi:hypothetical protein
METPAAPPVPQTSLKRTTSRGLATASFSLGFWGSCIFWWYPIGMIFASVGLILGLISLARGIRVEGRPGDHLAFAGVVMSSLAISAALAVYRGVQFFYENPYWFNMP